MSKEDISYEFTISLRSFVNERKHPGYILLRESRNAITRKKKISYSNKNLYIVVECV